MRTGVSSLPLCIRISVFSIFCDIEFSKKSHRRPSRGAMVGKTNKCMMKRKMSLRNRTQTVGGVTEGVEPSNALRCFTLGFNLSSIILRPLHIVAYRYPASGRLAKYLVFERGAGVEPTNVKECKISENHPAASPRNRLSLASV